MVGLWLIENEDRKA